MTTSQKRDTLRAHIHTLEAALGAERTRVARLLEACEGLVNRVERARAILQEQRGGHWGMLDTAEQRQAISEAKGQEDRR